VTAADAGRTTESKPSEGGGRLWLRRLITVVIALVVAVLGYFIAAAFIPRWWAQRVAHQVDSRFTLGVTWGLFYGVVFTFAAVLVALQARRQLFGWPVKIGLIVLALLLEIPNFMTLGIVLGTSGAAHAGERILDVEAPAFRSASLAGVIIGALLALGVFIMVSLVRTRGRQVKALQAEAKQRALDKKADAEAASQAARDAESQGRSG
jgi:Na+/proline symporter